MKKCDNCMEYKPDVEETIDPYMKELYNKEIECCLCDTCYQKIIEDI